MDRFSQDSPGHLSRNLRQSSEWEGPECECRLSGDMADASACDLHGPDAGDWNAEPTCQIRQRIIEWSDSVSEMAFDLARHDAVCRVCSPGLRREERRAA